MGRDIAWKRSRAPLYIHFKPLGKALLDITYVEIFFRRPEER